MSKPRKSSPAPPQPRKLPNRAPKVAKWPQKAKYQKVRKQKILQKESYLSIKAKPQQLFRPHLNPKHSPIDPKKYENDKKNQNSENKKKWKMKVITLQ